MTSFKINHRNEIYSLMEEFPLLSFHEIKSLALSLSIQGVHNEESILTEKNYGLLRDKLLTKLENDTLFYEDEDNFYQTSEFELHEKINFTIPTVSQDKKIEDKVSIRELQLEYKLKEAFIFQAIKFLDIKDINGDIIENGMDTRLVYVYKINSDQIVKKAHELNAINANRNNPLLNNPVQPANKKTNSLTIVKKASQLSIFERIIKKGTLVFIDTSSLMNDDMPEIINNEIIPILKKNNETVKVPDSVIHEIQVKMNQFDNIDNQRKAFSAKNILSTLAQDDLYQIPESHSISKRFADAEILSIVTDLRLKYNICVITNDNSKCKGGGLSNSIMELQTSTCINDDSIKDISVLYVKDKKLVHYDKNRDVRFTLHDKAPMRVVL